MQTINLKTTQKKTIEVDLSITVPSFYRSQDEREWVAILDKDTIVSLSTIGESFWVSKQRTDISTSKDKMVEAMANYYSCTETEFLQKYDEVIQSISKNTLLEV